MLRLLHIPTAITYDAYWITEQSIAADPEQWLCIRPSIVLDSDEDLAVFPDHITGYSPIAGKIGNMVYARAYEFLVVHR